MSHINVVYGKKDLVAVYKDGELCATHDKHTKHNGDLKHYLAKLQSEGHEIEESDGDFRRFAEIPPTAEAAGCTSTPKGDQNPDNGAKVDKEPKTEPKAPEQAAQTGTMKGEGSVTPAESKPSQEKEPDVPKEIAGRKPGTLSRSW